MSILFPFSQLPDGGIAEAKEHGFLFVAIDLEPSALSVRQAFKVNAITSSDRSLDFSWGLTGNIAQSLNVSEYGRDR